MLCVTLEMYLHVSPFQELLEGMQRNSESLNIGNHFTIVIRPDWYFGWAQKLNSKSSPQDYWKHFSIVFEFILLLVTDFLMLYFLFFLEKRKYCSLNSLRNLAFLFGALCCHSNVHTRAYYLIWRIMKYIIINTFLLFILGSFLHFICYLLALCL